jgi:hypothetical protein
MERRQASIFALVAAQTAHSLEECVGRLFDVLPPAVLVSDLLSADRRLGFVHVGTAPLLPVLALLLARDLRAGPRQVS